MVLEKHFPIATLTLCFIILITHSIAAALLVKIDPSKMNWNMWVLLLNLTIAQLILVITEIIVLCIEMGDSKKEVHQTIIKLGRLQQTAGAKVVLSGLMFFLTFDRFSEIYWNIQYHISLSPRRVAAIIILIWVTGFVSTTVMGVIIHVTNNEDKCLDFFFKYVHTTLNISYILFAIMVYLYLFKKFYNSRLTFHKRMQSLACNAIDKNINASSGTALQSYNKNLENSTKLKKIKVFKESNFYLPTLLILFYIILYVVPGIIYAILAFMEMQTLMAYSVVNIFYTFAILIDPVIYVFSSQPIRSTLLRMQSQRVETGFLTTTTSIIR